METWKAMAYATVGLVIVAGVVSVSEVSLSSPVGLTVLGLALVGVGLFYAVTKRGYRMGQQVGNRMQDRD